jgi:hypothetical protein
MRIISIPVVMVVLLRPDLAGRAGQGSICIAPLDVDPSKAGTPNLFCDSGNFSLRVDGRQPIRWPRAESLVIDSFDLGGRHRVVVWCDGKPQQSFTFRFSQFKSKQPCLFVNDLSRTVQLWEPRGAAWCKCK